MNSGWRKLPYGKTHVAIASTHRFNCPATMAIETLEATSYVQFDKCSGNVTGFLLVKKWKHWLQADDVSSN
ncbi:hypothetical protein OUZ56_019418 [Daphnia magna]|uniref:Uncharacterized protein n=1 Tax=Daphnia magna TaxID=35525 RepID=A0ABQ9ZBI7_9CRUS|nr:hypothetical protein OUZ56_019418 [Daphnia magna]